MASIYNFENNQRSMLTPMHLIGKDPQSDICLDSPAASPHHAVIFWDGRHWFLEDTSTQGTYLNGQRIPTLEKVKLQTGDIINFADLLSPNWYIEHVCAPGYGIYQAQERVETRSTI